MKKLILVFLAAALMIAGAALAEDLNLEGRTTAELIEIQQKVNEALWKSDGWNEVTVPPGIYKVGKEIPAGEWMIEKATSNRTCYNIYREIKNGNPQGLLLYTYLESGPEKTMIEEGQIIQIERQPVIFKTYVPSFTFK